MKSLEIVNRERDKLKADIDLGVIQKRNVELQNIDIVKLKELEQIKADLEVLEIIKKIFEKANFHFYPDGYEADILLEDNDICIEAIDRITKLKVADVKKLKQWLEENENDR